MRRALRRSNAFIAAVMAVVLWVGSAGATSAKGAVLMEASTGRVLYAENEDVRLPMASTTKILTAIIAIEKCSLDEVVKVSSSAAGTEGTSMYLSVGEKVTVRELLYGLLIASGNDAAIALACHISGSTEAFSELMNEKAREIGAHNSNFVNPNGLPDDNHYTTAADLARIAAYCMRNTTFREIVATQSIDLPQDDDSPARYLRSKNKLLWQYEGGNGIKTGFTKAAGKCFVGGAERDGMQLITVVLNDYAMWDDSKTLLTYGFENYDMHKIANAGDVMGSIRVEGGIRDAVKTELKEDICLPMTDEEYKILEDSIKLEEFLVAPVNKGETVGCLQVFCNGELLAEADIVTSEAVQENSFEYSLKRVMRSFISAFDWRKSANSKIYGSGRNSVAPQE